MRTQSLLVTFRARGERWRCVAGEHRLVLLRAPAGMIEESLAWAQL